MATTTYTLDMLTAAITAELSSGDRNGDKARKLANIERARGGDIVNLCDGELYHKTTDSHDKGSQCSAGYVVTARYGNVNGKGTAFPPDGLHLIVPDKSGAVALLVNAETYVAAIAALDVAA